MLRRDGEVFLFGTAMADTPNETEGVHQADFAGSAASSGKQGPEVSRNGFPMQGALFTPLPF
jgi:hypothetical protein